MVANLDYINSILRNNKLNVTEIRQQILDILLQPAMALTQKEMEELLTQRMNSVDRVTLYRNIKTLMQKKLIHQIIVGTNSVKYKLAGNHKTGNHPHFQCELCNRLVCMPHLQVQSEHLPEGFVMKSSSLIIEGVCASCNGKV
ncbi:Fur family transcriptional regulator [Alkalitalea saponilacus]|uniref:Fur family transcriptional regulator, ferric uptake regulator n=1 Tax=Alkalitalea saponilacus TaxID=889453 RepID=A0A1T5A6B8_9BACT|nr:transcriptional repressor [Alkalitalea saponilacus]ASB48838.1 transcriptional repressor [Alkalitalea saponilacus]SKB30297.1 Fur family transcriptional regulator, ferric uptake regulator [Alkalitalea saponilacus]